MTVAAIFWFYPVVWWLGTRLLEERERACDEEVLRLGNNPAVYAESILKLCELYVTSPLKCVSGITGTNLQRRIEGIVKNQTVRRLNFGRRMLLIVSAAMAVAAPIAVGMASGRTTRPQAKAPASAFEVVSVKLNNSTDTRDVALQYLPGGRFVARGVPLFILIQEAYKGERIAPSAEFQKLDGSVIQRRYDVEAIAPAGAILSGTPSQARNEKLRQMLQGLLADRFKLKTHRESKQQPVYALVVAKNGPKLQASMLQEKECGNAATDLFDAGSCHMFAGGQGQGLHGPAVDMSDLAGFLVRFADKAIVNRTGLNSLYNIQTVGWRPLVSRPPRPDGGTESQRAEDLALADPNTPTLNDVLDGLGLKLETETATVETLFLDYIADPSQN
jgi:uncharacterized protein (TIGR03435 family)